MNGKDQTLYKKLYPQLSKTLDSLINNYMQCIDNDKKI